MKIILGSGIVGLLAKLILGPSWTIVPFYKSRFFSYNPSLDDNFLIRDPNIDDVVKQILNTNELSVYPYKKAWSIAGHIYPQWDDSLCGDWLHKIFQDKIPAQSLAYNKNRMVLNVYDIRLNELYTKLLNLFIKELKDESSKGQLSEIGDHYIVRGGQRIDIEQIVNTIPLNKVCELANLDVDLPSKNIHYWHIGTTDLDFEGNNQLLVADNPLGFYKVTNIAPNRYMFYCHEDIPNPGTYLMAFIKKFEIIDGTTIPEAMPLGNMPNTDILKRMGIFNVGSYAEWDWCADVGSNILRLIRFANRGNKDRNA